MIIRPDPVHRVQCAVTIRGCRNSLIWTSPNDHNKRGPTPGANAAQWQP